VLIHNLPIDILEWLEVRKPGARESDKVGKFAEKVMHRRIKKVGKLTDEAQAPVMEAALEGVSGDDLADFAVAIGKHTEFGITAFDEPMANAARNAESLNGLPPLPSRTFARGSSTGTARTWARAVTRHGPLFWAKRGIVPRRSSFVRPYPHFHLRWERGSCRSAHSLALRFRPSISSFSDQQAKRTLNGYRPFWRYR
jgi:hypothetical protein